MWKLLLTPAVCVAALPASAGPITEAHRLRVEGGRLVDGSGATVGLYGVNLFESHLMWSRRQDPAEADAALTAIAGLGFNAVRMPLNMAWFEPAPGVFPASGEYEGILREHGLPTGAVAFYDGLVQRAGELGLYVIPEFHELPTDPYRWFVGGEERDRGTDKPGRAIAWLGVPQEGQAGRHALNAELAAREVPRALGWLAAHWRGVPNIAGIEVPWNEPGGPLTEGGAYFGLVESCARAVKAADPQRLVLMDCVDWGAMVNRIPDDSVWKLPAEVDVLFPHFYPGMHSSNSGEAGTWATSMANWASWMVGSGRPVMVGEYGVVEMKRAGYWKDGASDAQRAATYAASAAQWYAMGVQGVFCWAWDGGIGRDEATGALTEGAEALPKWAAAYEQTVPCAADAEIAVVCSSKHRAQYGDRRDLWSITDALLDAHLTPFATVFDSQVAAEPSVLNRFRFVLTLDADLSAEADAALKEAGEKVIRLPADLTGLAEAVTRIGEALAPPDLPPNVIVGYADRQAVVFERKAQAGKVRLRLRVPGAEGRGRLVDEAGAVVFEGAASDLARDGADVALGAWQCEVLRWQK